MTIPGSANPLLAYKSTAYQISRSLRFNSADSAYLSRTPSVAGNNRTWTWAGWVKRSALGGTTVLMGVRVSGVYTLITIISDQLYFYNGSYYVYTTPMYRDPSAWYHIVVVYEAANATQSDRMRIYVNGSRVTDVTASYPPTTTQDSYFNQVYEHNIGRDPLPANYFDGYLADIHFIDGQALTPTSFGQFDTNGVWQPKAYSGTYGTNGFRLPFSDNSAATATTLGKDSAGSNNWTPNNLSVTAGVGNDSLVDSPTNGTASSGGDAGGVVVGNYATLNPLDKASAGTLSNGNLKWVGDGTSSYRNIRGTQKLDGKVYFEALLNVAGVAGSIGIAPGTDYAKLITDSAPTDYLGSSAWGNNSAVIGGAFGTCYSNGSSAGSFTGANGDILMCAFDSATGKVWFGRNGTWLLSGNPGSGTNPTFTIANTLAVYPAATARGTDDIELNFGQRPFAYAAPSGFKALCSTNLPTPTILKGSSVMDIVLYTGTGASLTPTSSLGFSPDLVWIKGRSGATDNTIYDSVRGAQARLETNNTDSEVTTDGGLTAFNSNGFTLGTLAQVNTNTATYASWCWDENVSAGFDIVTYTGNGANRTIAHSLGIAPQFLIVKQRTTASTTNWAVWHTSLANTEYVLLNSTAAKATGTTYWNSTSPTASNFSLGTSADVNTNSGTYVAYLWTPVSGYSAFGSYTGNGSADGPFVYCNFRPRFAIIKRVDVANSWHLMDSARNTSNGVDQWLEADTASIEADGLDPNLYLDFVSNGFKIKTTAVRWNASAGTYIYAAFAENPFSISRAR